MNFTLDGLVRYRLDRYPCTGLNHASFELMCMQNDQKVASSDVKNDENLSNYSNTFKLKTSDLQL